MIFGMVYIRSQTLIRNLEFIDHEQIIRNALNRHDDSRPLRNVSRCALWHTLGDSVVHLNKLSCGITQTIEKQNPITF